MMKLQLSVVLLALAMSACSSFELQNYDDLDRRDQQYYRNTVNMNDYERQRYHDLNQLGPVPFELRDKIRPKAPIEKVK